MVTRAGALAATEYGASVNGVSDKELEQLRTLASAGMTPAAQGRSLTALLAIKGDPTARAAVAPILQWARTVWRTDVKSDGGDTTAADLVAAWLETAEQRQCLVAKNGTRRWGQIRGPIGAMFLSLDRISWRTDDGINLVDDLGSSG